ncbi:MAG: ATP-binding protein [Allobaculum sp.]|nr:ATP-binding protein [Allobaculum sp.]
MIILITGASHTGKTLLAQKLLEKYQFPVLSLDLLKMGLIRSGNTPLTPEDDSKLTDYLWPIAKEMIKTAIENNQNLIIEGCYIPLNWRQDFDEFYLSFIQFICLILSENYIRNHFEAIKRYANVIEQRLEDEDCTLERVLEDNAQYLSLVQKYGESYHLIDQTYALPITD